VTHEEDRRIHDYLDGRLSASERAAFEARLETDPDLAERVRSYRDLGSALRDGDDGLSPGFYTRARAEFVSRTADARHPWLRWLSWETAGLVAATVLAITVFVPGLIRDETPLPVDERAVQGRPMQKRSVGDAARPERAPVGTQDEGGKGDVLTEQLRIDAPENSRKKKEQTRQLAEEEVTLDDSDREGARATPPVPDAKDAREDRFAPSPPPKAAAPSGSPGAAAPADETTADKMRQSATAPGDRRTNEAAGSEPQLERAVAGRSFGYAANVPVPPIARPLPAGVVARGEVRVLGPRGAGDDRRGQDQGGERDESKGSAEKQSRAAASAQTESQLETFDTGAGAAPGRTVQIGPRDRPFSCASITLTRDADGWRIGIPPWDPDGGTAAAEHGCELTLPDDGLPFRIVETDGDE
jgi:hypothetical protein